MPAENIAVFSSDGEGRDADMAVRLANHEDDRAWLIEGTAVGELVREELLVDSRWPEVKLQPATGEALRGWFMNAALALTPGDTLLVD